MVAAVRGGLLSLEEACSRYTLTVEEFLSWQHSIDEHGLAGIFLLEVNTQPGMTPTSLSPEQAAHLGLGFPDLCRWIVEDASCNR